MSNAGEEKSSRGILQAVEEEEKRKDDSAASNDVFRNLDLDALKTHEERYQRALMLRKKSMLVLRKQCLYVLNVLRRALERTVSKREFTVGVIGAGDVGREITDMILESGGVSPQNIALTARNADSLTHYLRAGITCSSDNVALCQNCRLIFLCCSPTQLMSIAREIKGCVRRSTMVCSVVVGFSKTKLQRLLGVEAIVRCFVNSQRLRDGRTGYLNLAYDDGEICEATVSELLRFRRAVTLNVRDASAGDGRKADVEWVFPSSIFKALKWVCGTLGLDQSEAGNVAASVLLSSNAADSTKKDLGDDAWLEKAWEDEPERMSALFKDACLMEIRSRGAS